MANHHSLHQRAPLLMFAPGPLNSLGGPDHVLPFLAPQNSFHTKTIELHLVESCVHGFHVYQDILTPTTGECLSCQKEDSNAFDPYAAAIRKKANVIGHIPRKIPAVHMIIDSCHQYSCHGVNTDDIILAKFKFGGLVMIHQFAKFSFPPKFIVIQYTAEFHSLE